MRLTFLPQKRRTAKTTHFMHACSPASTAPATAEPQNTVPAIARTCRSRPSASASPATSLLTSRPPSRPSTSPFLPPGPSYHSTAHRSSRRSSLPMPTMIRRHSLAQHPATPSAVSVLPTRRALCALQGAPRCLCCARTWCRSRF